MCLTISYNNYNFLILKAIWMIIYIISQKN